jgi:hypothetical protein
MLLAPPGTRPDEFSQHWHAQRNPTVAKLLGLQASHTLPLGIRATGDALEALYRLLDAGRINIASILNSGLDEVETKDLLTTRDIRRAAKLVLKGLATKFQFESWSVRG